MSESESASKKAKVIEAKFTKLPYQIILEITKTFYLFECKDLNPPQQQQDEPVVDKKPIPLQEYFGWFHFDRTRKTFLIFASYLVYDRKWLKTMPTKGVLSLQFQKFESLDVEFVKKCENIKVLSKAALDENSIIVLSPKIEYLICGVFKVTDKLMQGLNKLKNLHTLSLFTKNIDLELTEDLTLKGLKSLHGYIPSSVSFNHLENLEKLTLKNLPSVVNVSLNPIKSDRLLNISKLDNLSTLVFSDYDINDIFYEIFKMKSSVIAFIRCIISEKHFKEVIVPIDLVADHVMFEGIRNIPIEFIRKFPKLKNFVDMLISFKDCDLAVDIVEMMKNSQLWQKKSVVIENNFTIVHSAEKQKKLLEEQQMTVAKPKKGTEADAPADLEMQELSDQPQQNQDGDQDVVME